MTVLLLRQVRLFSNTLMLINGHSKKISYGTEHLANIDEGIRGLWNTGDDIAPPHDIVLVDERLPPACNRVSKHQLCFDLSANHQRHHDAITGNNFSATSCNRVNLP